MNYEVNLQLVWEEFLGMLVRFFSRRFQDKPDNQEVVFLRGQLIRLRNDYKELVESINKTPEPVPQVEEQVDYKPIGKPHWRVKAAELERASREQKKKQEEAKRVQANQASAPNPGTVTEESTIEALERDLGIQSEIDNVQSNG